MKPHFLILAGDGINCERETAQAFEAASGRASIIHINDLIASPSRLRQFQGLAIPGGFSFGDELGSGQLLALKIRHCLGDEFFSFVGKGRPVIGICNGFQALAKLGLLPGGERLLALAPNSHGRFVDTWSQLCVHHKSVCRWSVGLPGKVDLPVRHAEGRVFFPAAQEEDLLAGLTKRGQIVFTYQDNPNGAAGNIAGLCDPSGLILGMMPHPEAALFRATGRNCRPDWASPADGHGLFASIVSYLQAS